MNIRPPTSYTHRTKADGSHDSICLACLATFNSSTGEAFLAREEEDHVCKFAFPTQRTKPIRWNSQRTTQKA